MSDGDPLVTIVTPSYNQGRYIAEAVRSVAEQDYARIEHIVVDAESTDGTLEALAPFADRITLVCEPDDGQGDAISKGFALGRGEILGWINADDLLLPGAVRRAVEALRARPDAAFVHGDCLIVDASGREVGRHRPPPSAGFRALAHLDFVLQPTAYFTRRRWEEVGGIRTELRWALDWDLFLRLARLGPLLRIEGGPLAAARVYPETKTSTGGGRRFLEIVGVLRSHRTPSWGYVFHVVELLERWVERLQRPGRFGHNLEASPFAPVREAIARRAARSVVSGDGWAGPDVTLTVPPGSGGLLVHGSLPDWCPLPSQRLRVDGGWGSPIEHDVATGAFTLALPDTSGDIRVHAAHRFSPHRTGLGPDRRMLSWQFDRIVRQPSR